MINYEKGTSVGNPMSIQNQSSTEKKSLVLNIALSFIRY